MALADTANSGETTDEYAKSVAPVSLTSPWTWFIKNNGVAVADNSGNTITNPDDQITTSTRRIVRRSQGTTLRLALCYDAIGSGGAITTQLVVQVFGRTPGQPWQRLENGSGDHEVTITAVPATDPESTFPGTVIGNPSSSDKTKQLTVPDATTHSWDCDGCSEILVGVKTAFDHDDTEVENALLGKFI